MGTGGVSGESDHLGNLGFGDSSQACIQLQVLTTGQQLEDGIRLRAVAHAAVSSSRFLGHAGDGGWGTGNSGHWLALAMRGASRGLGAHPPYKGQEVTQGRVHCRGTQGQADPVHICESRGRWGGTRAREPLTCGLPEWPRPHWAACPQSPCGMWMFSLLRSRPAARNTAGTPTEGTHRSPDNCPSISDFWDMFLSFHWEGCGQGDPWADTGVYE